MSLGELEHSGMWVDMNKNNPSDFSGNIDAYLFVVAIHNDTCSRNKIYSISMWDKENQNFIHRFNGCVTHWKPVLAYRKGLVLMSKVEN